MEVEPPGLPVKGGARPLSPGDRVTASVISSDGKGGLILNVRGVKTAAFAEGAASPGKSVRVEVLQTEPELKVRILPENPSSRQAARSGPVAALISESAEREALSGMKSGGAKIFKDAVPLLAREAASFSQKEVADILKNLGGARISAFLPEEIKKAVRDGGNFFENKLLKGISPEKDAKALAYASGNDAARGAVTKMQIANILMNADIFTFFDGDDELDFDNGVMRFRKTPSGDMSLYMKVDFTHLGETVISFAKAPESCYYVTVRTEKDISGDLASVNIPGLFIRWARLGPKDCSFFEIKPGDFSLLDNFDLKA